MVTKTVPGYIIKRSFARPPAKLVSRFAAFSSANLSDVMGKANTLDYRIKPLRRGDKLLGPALTIRTRPGDNLLSLKAIELAQPADVIVISGAFDTNYSVWGGIMSIMASRAGIAGLVTDGLVRDAEQIEAAGFIVFAAGLTPVGPSKEGPGHINLPISCGGVIIHPGDIIRGDADGVVVIPQQDAEGVLDRAQQRIALEESWIARIHQGELILMEDDEQCAARGCQIID